MALRIEGTSKNEDSEKTIYRFKTEKEFINEFGINFKIEKNFASSGSMDYLFGSEISEESYDKIQLGEKHIPEGNTWYINKYMVTKEPLKKSSKDTVKLSDKLLKKQPIIKLNQNN